MYNFHTNTQMIDTLSEKESVCITMKQIENKLRLYTMKRGGGATK